MVVIGDSLRGMVTKVYVKRVKAMKYMRDMNCGILAGIVLVLCCTSTTTFASSGDEPTFGIYPPDWPQPYPVSYPSLLPLEPSDIIGGDDPINLEDIDLDFKYVLLPERPRFNGVPPIEHIDIGTLFDSYYLSTNTYGIAPSFDVTSYSMERSAVAIPEPATVLLLGMGALVLRRRKRA